MSSAFQALQKKPRLYSLLKIAGIVAYFLIFAAWLGRSFLHGQGIASVEDMTPLVSLRQLMSFVFGNWFDATQTYTFRSKYILFLSAAFYAPLTGVLTIILSALAGIFNYLSIYLLIKLIIRTKYNLCQHVLIILAASNVTLFVLLTHISNYYSIGFGISLMSLSISLFIYALLSPSFETSSKLFMLGLIIAVLLQWTASLHVLVIYFFSIGIFSLWAVLLWPNRLRRIVILWATLFVFYVMPFGYYIFKVTPVAAAADATFVTFPQMDFGSLTPLDNFAFSFYSLISIFIGRSYSIPPPQPWFIVQTLAMLSIFIFPKRRYLRNRITLGILGMYLLSLFFSGGLKSSFSGYQLALAVVPRIPISAVKSAILLLITTLRYPFRWMYLLIYCWGIFLTLFGFEFYGWANVKLWNRTIAGILPLIIFCGLLFMPYLGEPFSLSSTFSGDYGVNFEPMTIPRELTEIRSILHQRTLVGKLVVWPSPGSERVNFGDNIYLLNDTFYNIFLDVPAILGTWGTPHANFLSVQLGYQLADWGEPGIGAYLASQGIEYLLLREDSMVDNTQTETARIRRWLEKQPDLSLEFNGQRYALFRVRGLKEALLPSKAITFYVASVKEPVRLLQRGLTPSSTAMIDLSAGTINRETIQKIREYLPPERMTYYFPKEENRQDALISTMTASTGVVDTIGAYETLKQELEPIVLDFWYPKLSDIYSQFRNVFGRYGALQGKAFIFDNQSPSAVLPLELQRAGQYSIFVKLFTPAKNHLNFQLDGGPEQMVNVPGAQDYHYIKVYDTWLTVGNHELGISLQGGSVIISAAYAVLNTDLADYTAWFDEITRDFTFTRRSDLIRHLDSLSIPKDGSQIFFLSKYVYDPSIHARLGEELLAPLPAWYSQMAYISPQAHTSKDVEILMDTDRVSHSTRTYMLYMLVLFLLAIICLGFIIGGSKQLKIKPRKMGPDLDLNENS